MQQDDWFDDSGWLEDMASLAFAAILIVFVLMFVAVGFWLWGWL